MANNSVLASILIRSGIASNWSSRNPILQQGEYGFESDTGLLKIGDGIHDWNHLPYLNKLHSKYFKQNEDGTITFSDEFIDIVDALQAAAGQAIEHLTIVDPPVEDTDVPNKKYVDDAIAAAGHLKREIVVNLPDAASADPNTLYMVPATNGEYYEEYMVVNGVWDMVGSTGDGGSGGGFQLEVATTSRLGGVKASIDPDTINVTAEGIMTLNQVSTSKLYVPTGDTFTIYGGSA